MAKQVILPLDWELEIKPFLDLDKFYLSLNKFINDYDFLCPKQELIFSVFYALPFKQVKAILLGEDPYPRQDSANGIAFYDAAFKTWTTKSRNASLKNIFKALLIEHHQMPIKYSYGEAIEFAHKINVPEPPDLFNNWLNSGLLLLNTSLTFSNALDKKKHFDFWHPFIQALLHALSNNGKIFYLWGNKAQQWESEILKNNIKHRIIKRPHPTYAHHFLIKDKLFLDFKGMVKR